MVCFFLWSLFTLCVRASLQINFLESIDVGRTELSHDNLRLYLSAYFFSDLPIINFLITNPFTDDHPTKPLATAHVSICIWPSLSHKTFPKYWEIDKNVFFVQHIQHPTKSFSLEDEQKRKSRKEVFWLLINIRKEEVSLFTGNMIMCVENSQ